MKLTTFIITMCILFALTPRLFSQDDDDDDTVKIKMNQKQWHLERDQYAVSAIMLLSRLDTLNMEIDSLQSLDSAMNEESTQKINQCETELYALVGATKYDVDQYRQIFDAAEKKINTKSGTQEEWVNTFKELTDSKIRCLPEFSSRYESMKIKIDALNIVQNQTQEIQPGAYEVNTGDCLWKIANIKYGNPFLWPAIWDANRRGVLNTDKVNLNFEKKISNPNLIYPGQVLKIPTLKEKDYNK